MQYLKNHKFKKSISLLLFFSVASLLFFFGGQIVSKAQQLGFTPQLIDSFNCVLGTGQQNSNTAQAVHLCEESGTGAIQATAGLMDSLYQTPPNSSIVWAYDQYNKIFDRELLAVYAQDPATSSLYFPGLGYDLLRPMLSLWQWSRNIVYTFYIIIVIFIAFLILFRQSLGGQTAVTLANAFPSLIVSLLLVSFSYPIAGFFVDLIYIGSNVVQSVMISTPGAPGNGLMGTQFMNVDDNIQVDSNQVEVDDHFTLLQPDDQAISLWAIWGASKIDILNCKNDNGTPNDPSDDTNCTNNLLPDLTTSNSALLWGQIISSFEQISEELVNNVAGNGLLNLVLGLTAFMAMFRLFMALLKSYVLLIIAPVYLPWLFLMAAIPSRTKSSITNALKPLLAASLSFIAVYALFLFMIILGNSESLGSAFQNAGQLNFTPPLLGYSPTQTGASIDGNITRGLIIYILFLAAPTIPEMISGWLNVQGGSKMLGNAAQSTLATAGTIYRRAPMLRSLIPEASKKKNG